MPSKLDLRAALAAPYDGASFLRDVLRPVSNGHLTTVHQQPVPVAGLTANDERLVSRAVERGGLTLDDGTEVRWLEATLRPGVRPEQSRVGIQQLVRRLLLDGQAALVCFVPDAATSQPWRLTLVARTTALDAEGTIRSQTTHARRYTYLLGPGQATRTAAERLGALAGTADLTLAALIRAFEVEALSKEFFNEYRKHYEKFCDYLTGSNFRTSVFNGQDKDVRDFVKKLLGRIVFLYFVQKKGWLGASSTAYTDGPTDFITRLFHASGGDATFYPTWLSQLFFETLNQPATAPGRAHDAFRLPDGTTVCIPFLNGGLFDRDAHDKPLLTLTPTLFHQPATADVPNLRGFLDFLDAYNFTVQEDAPDDHVVAVDPEMLGHIFENLLEDNKDKGAFYTPKQIVHYMCRESLIEYLDTRLNIFEEPLGAKVVRGMGAAPVQQTRAAKAGQLTLTAPQQRGNIQRAEIERFVQDKEPTDFIRTHARQIDGLLDTVRICDPAIGSGAFPMGLLHEIYLCRLALKDLVPAQTNSLFHERDLSADPAGFHAAVKRRIIQQSIYGVDIERGAVDIARLRFWLSLVVDEDRPRPLPNLDYKIVVGNSLVSKLDDEPLLLNWNLRAGTARETALRQQYVALGKLQTEFFTQSGEAKKALQTAIRNQKIELLRAQVELELEKIPKPQATMFGGGTAKERAAAVANQAKRQGYEAQLRRLTELEKSATAPLPYFDWRLDFPEILNPHVTDEPGFDIVIGNPPYDVYEGSKKGEIEELNAMPMYDLAKGGKLNAYKLFLALSHTLTKFSTGIMCEIFQNSFLADASAKKLRKFFLDFQRILQIDSFPERDNVQKRVFESAKMSVCILFSQNTKGTDDFKLNLWKNRDQTEGHQTALTSQLVYALDPESVTIPTLAMPEIELLEKITESGKTQLRYFAHCFEGEINLTFHKEFLRPTESGHSPMIKGAAVQKWHIRRDKMSQGTIEFLDADAYLQANKGKKSMHHLCSRLVMQGITGVDEKSRLKMTMLDAGIFCGNSVNYVLLTDDRFDIKFVLAMLNSRLLNWFFKATSTNSNVNGYEVDNLPFVSKVSDQQPFITLVDEILTAKSQNPLTDTTALEAEIDLLVYHLYALTYAEAKLVDPALALTEAEYAAAAGRLG